MSVNAGANVTANVLTLGGLVTSGNVNTGNVITTGDITISGNTTSQNIKLTNTDISATISSGTITIDAKEKTYGTAPLVVSTTDVSNLVFSNLITGAQIVVPILASGGEYKYFERVDECKFLCNDDRCFSYPRQTCTHDTIEFIWKYLYECDWICLG